MKKSYQFCFARLLCVIVFSYFSCCFGLPTATFSCNRSLQSNHFVSNNAARIRAAQQMHATDQVRSLSKGMGNSSGSCGKSNTVQQKNGQQCQTKTVYTEDQKKQELQKHEQEQKKRDQEQQKLACEKIAQQKRDEYVTELHIAQARLLDRQSKDARDHDNIDRQQFDDKFVHVIEQMIDGDYSITSVEYILSVESRSVLHDLELNYADFAHCTGNIVQLQKHEEVVFLANEFGLLHEQSRFESLSRTMFGFVDGARESNGASNVQASCEITNFCWNILKYVKAVGTGVVSGAGSGLCGVVHTFRHPDHAAASLYKAGAFLADIVYDMTCYDFVLEQHAIGQFVVAGMEYPPEKIDEIAEKYAKMGKELRQVYQKFRDKPGPEKVHLITAVGTDFLVSGYTYGALARGAGKLFASAGSQLKELLNKCKKRASAGQLIACAEGAELKIAAETDGLLAKSVEKNGEIRRSRILQEDISKTDIHTNVVETGITLSELDELKQLESIIENLNKITSNKKFGKIEQRVQGVKEYLRLEEEAISYYSKTRTIVDDIEKISRNTSIPESIIGKIKKHVFMNKHLLNGEVQYFSACPDMAAAWQRLISKTFVQSDLKLLLHEYAEALIMSKKNMQYDTAHSIVNKIESGKYNWQDIR